MNAGHVGDKIDNPAVDFEQVCERSALLRRLKPLLLQLADGPLMLRKFNSDIARWDRESSAYPFTSALIMLDVEPFCVAGDCKEFSRGGPLIVVSNHPFGALEVLCMGSLLEQAHPGFKLIGTEYLNKIPPISNSLIAVDSFGRTNPTRRNIQPLRAALRHLKSDGALLVYPSGRVSHFRISKFGITDPEWSSHIVKLAIASKAKVVPVFFHGKNSMFFNFAGMLHPLFRTLLLVREFYKRAEESQIRFRIGETICSTELTDLDERRAVAKLRSAVYDLNS